MNIPAYTGGPITSTIEAWIGGTGYGLGNLVNGRLTWTEPEFTVGGAPDTFHALSGPIPLGIPEPGVPALAVLGSLAWSVNRKRRAARKAEIDGSNS